MLGKGFFVHYQGQEGLGRPRGDWVQLPGGSVHMAVEHQVWLFSGCASAWGWAVERAAAVGRGGPYKLTRAGRGAEGARVPK